jgi:hypothetical protein
VFRTIPSLRGVWNGATGVAREESDAIRFSPVSDNAIRKVKQLVTTLGEPRGFYSKFYSLSDGVVTFILPAEKRHAEDYRNRLVKAGFKIKSL